MGPHPARNFQAAAEPLCADPLNLAPRQDADVLPLVSPDGRTLLARNAAGEPAVFAVDDLVRGVTGPKVLRGLDGAGVTRVSWAAGTVFVQTPDRYLRCALPTGACAAYQPGREEVAGTARLVVRFPA